MNIDRLKRMSPPPLEPLFSASKEEWETIQKWIGLPLPEEYFVLASAYGSGRFLSGEFKVANPFDPDDDDFAEKELRRVRDAKERSPEEVPFTLLPEPGGLYPFGIDGNGNTFLWVAHGDPKNWPIACFNSEDYSEVVNASLIEFLLLLSTNQLPIDRRRFWGDDFQQDEIDFVARRPPTPRLRRPRRS